MENQEVISVGENPKGAQNTDVVSVLSGLSAAHKRFSEYYAWTNNVLRSSVLAGFHRDYGHYLLKDERIQHAVAYFRELLLDKNVYTAEKLMRQWARQASFSPTSLLHNDWSIKNLDELPPEIKEQLDDALVGFEVVQKTGSRTIKPKFAKIEAQEHLGKLMKLYEQDKAKGDGIALTINMAHIAQVPQAIEPQEVGPLTIAQESTE